MECINRYFELHVNHETTFHFLNDLCKFQKMSEEMLICHCINLYLKLNSDLCEIYLYEKSNI